MSKLADLLNPAPSSTVSNAPRPTVTTPSPSSSSHRRNESITSPLEALAIAATNTTTPSVTQPRSAVTSPSFPPNPYLNTNPYAIKPQQPSPATRPPSHPTASSQSPPASATSAALPPQKHSQSSASLAMPSLTSQQPKEDAAQTVVKTELSDEPTLAPLGESKDAVVKTEEAIATLQSQDEDAEMKDNSTVDTKAVREPKKTVAATKKGTAKAKKDNVESTSAPRKSITKKRKLDPESKDGTPFSNRSGTPGSRTSRTPAHKRTPQQSPAPAVQTANNADDDLYEEGSDDEVFCICRRPDDHTWMIACDGGCDDWFHGACVRMNEADGALIDKYICPNCEAAGQGRTMWKPMCRLQGCREPARAAGKKPSKYCSDEHGRQFMREKVFGKVGKSSGKSSKADDARKRRKSTRVDDNAEDHSLTFNGEDSDDGHQAHLRGGVLKPGELKALATSVKNAEEFRRLGERISMPVADDAGDKKHRHHTDTNGDIKMEDGAYSAADEIDADAPRQLSFTEQEQAALDAAMKQRDELNAQLAMLADKDKLLAMVKARHKSTLDELRKKDKTVKDICGYDSRLMWSDEEFNNWRSSDEGKSALVSSILPAPSMKRKPDETNGTVDGGSGGDDEEIGRGMCKRKRCERHKTWAKLEQQDINLMRSQCWHQMRKIDRDEEELKDRALMRQRESR